MGKQLVTGEIVELDYKTLYNTEYRGCKLIFKGGNPPSVSDCSFIECEFIFDGAARNTQMFLTMLAQSGAADLVVNGMLGLDDWAPK